MAEAKPGNTVKVHYTGTLRSGAEFDSSRDREPLNLTLGAGEVIPGFEKALEGMVVGETKTVTIPSQEAYGPRMEEAVQQFPRDALPTHLDLRVGQQLQAQNADGSTLLLTVTTLDDDTVTLDGNHPLAGEDLTFELEVVDIA
ncbi:MAG: peptidylprolyl isomerase [Candidatus Competibacterales bacterium]